MMLADTSAWATAERDADVLDDFHSRILRIDIATCVPVMLELLRTSRNVTEFRRTRSQLDVLDRVRVTDAIQQRAIDVYELLASTGASHHRQVSHPDLLIAAAAESAGIPVLHYDKDFDAIAAVTGQATEWIVPRGTF